MQMTDGKNMDNDDVNNKPWNRLQTLWILFGLRSGSTSL